MRFIKCVILYQGVVMAESAEKVRAVNLAKAAAEGFSEDVTVTAIFADDHNHEFDRSIKINRWGGITKLWELDEKEPDVFHESDNTPENPA